MNEPINKIQNSSRLTFESLKVFNMLCLVKVLGQVRYTKDAYNLQSIGGTMDRRFWSCEKYRPKGSNDHYIVNI